MGYLNTSSGLTDVLDRLTGQLDAAGQANAQTRGLVAAGILPPGAAPSDSILTRMQNAIMPSTVQSLAAPAPALAPAVPQAPGAPPVTPPAAPVTPPAVSAPMAYAPPSVGAAMPPVARPPAPSQPATGPSMGVTSLPTFAALQGASPSTGPGALFSGVEQKFGLPAGYLGQTAMIESRGDPNARNPSGAGGLFQFMPSTAKQYGINPFDPVASTYAAGRLAADNAVTLSKALGRAPTAGELYLAHQQGAGGAAQLLSNPNARAGDIVGNAAVRANGGDPNMTAGQFANLWMSRFGTGVQGGGAPASSVGGAALGQSGRNGSPAPLRPPVSAFGGLPVMAQSPQVGALSPATALARPSQPVQTDAEGNALNPDDTPTALNYSPATGVVTAPASRAIAAAPPVAPVDPPVTVPGFAGTWTQASADATDADNSPTAEQVAAAQKRVPQPPQAALQAPATAPGVANAVSPQAPLQQAPNPAATASPGGVTMDQIKALIFNPATRTMGWQLFQEATKSKDGFTLNEGQARFNAQGQQIAAVAKAETDPARPLTAEEKQAYGLSPDGAFEMQGGKVFAVPGTYSERGGVDQAHVVRPGEALVNNKGVALYRAEGASTDPTMIESLARRVYLGDGHALQNLGRGAQGGRIVEAVQARVAQLTQLYHGGPLPDLPERDILDNQADQIGNQAGARASGTLNARLDTYAKEASGAMDLGVQASRQVPRTTWTPLNRAMQAVQSGSGNPELAAFVAANNAIINTYAKAINPNGVPTVSDKVHASEVLSVAQSPEAYEATVRQLQREINIAHNAARGARAAERSGSAADNIAVTAPDPGTPGTASVGVGDMVSGRAPAAPVRVSTPNEAMALPSGTLFMAPDGRIKVRP